MAGRRAARSSSALPTTSRGASTHSTQRCSIGVAARRCLLLVGFIYFQLSTFALVQWVREHSGAASTGDRAPRGIALTLERGQSETPPPAPPWPTMLPSTSSHALKAPATRHATEKAALFMSSPTVESPTLPTGGGDDGGGDEDAEDGGGGGGGGEAAAAAVDDSVVQAELGEGLESLDGLSQGSEEKAAAGGQRTPNAKATKLTSWIDSASYGRKDARSLHHARSTLLARHPPSALLSPRPSAR